MVKVKRRKPIKTKKKPDTRYKLKPAFAEDAKERSRKNYRTSKGKGFELDGNVVLRSLEFIDDEAETMLVINQITNGSEVLPVIRLTHAAKLLNVSYQTLWRWTSETQQVPMPVLVDTSSGREFPVYHVDEVRIMVRVIGEHLKAFKYYRKDHEGPKSKLFDQIEALRALNFNQTAGDKNGSQENRSRTRRKGKNKRYGGK